MEKSKKYIFRTIFGILSIIVAVIIFIFSSQNSTESSKTSDGVIRTIIEILPNTKNLSKVKKDEITDNMTFIVRKLAHFSIYALLGINVIAFLLTFNNNIRKQLIITLFICILYAISDEFHQMFSDGRSPMIRDVFIDGLGSLAGSGIVGIIYHKFGKTKK